MMSLHEMYADLVQTPHWDSMMALALQLTPVMPDCLDASYLQTSFGGDQSSTGRFQIDAFDNNISNLCVKIH